MSDEGNCITEGSSKEYESESESMNGTEYSNSDTTFNVNNSSYNAAIEPISQET